MSPSAIMKAMPVGACEFWQFSVEREISTPQSSVQ